MTRRDREEKLKQRIIEEAEKQFFAVGFSAVTMDDLAGRLGMSKKTLYKLFASKQELLHAVMQKIIDRVEASTGQVFEDESLGFLEKLHQILSFMVLHLMRLRQPILDDIRRNAMDVWEEFDSWRQEKVIAKFGSLIRQGMAEGLIRQDLDPDLLTLIHTTLVRRVMNPETLSSLPLSASQAFAALMTVLYEGILTPEARQQYRGPGVPLMEILGPSRLAKSQPPAEDS
ncbi:MAG TPA: TetR/AcrR family transcriptional regulator [Acidobacteriota bacterium]|nr:TetR/AcrR family transcriptional regulator [Acidobacteriota bacterium]